MSDDTYGWNFARQWAGEGSSGGLPATYALDMSRDGLVREGWQNLNDEGPIGEPPVEAIATVRELTGEDREEFLRLLDWKPEDSDGESLKEHVDHVARDHENTEEFLETMEEEDRLVTLTIEDRNTRGLLGVGGDGRNFSALALDELQNNKPDDSDQGGSYGLGKFSYPSWSGISTVLYSSALSEPDPRDDDPRLFGHAYFPTHGDPDEEYEFEGDGFFGRLSDDGRATVSPGPDGPLYKWGDENSGQPTSLWGDEAAELLSDLGIPRDTESPGTSVTIVGVCHPAETTQPDPEELGDAIADAVSKWFWPAIEVGQLETTVDTPTREFEVDSDHNPSVRPFVDAFRARGEAGADLDHPGDVAVKSPDIEIPDKADGATTTDGPIDVGARLADPNADGEEEDLLDTVALIRGAGMVVKYYPQRNVVYGDRHFHGFVLAGRARPWGDGAPTESDQDIDEYLRATEPPSHNDWSSQEATIHQREKYGSGYLERMKDVKSAISSTLRELVGGVTSNGDRVAPELADRLGITGRGPPPESTPVLRAREKQLTYDREANCWQFESRIAPAVDDHHEWNVDVGIDRLAKNGRRIDSIEIAHLDCDEEGEGVVVTETSDGYRLIVDESLDEIHVRGLSEPDTNSGRTRLDFLGEVTVGGES